MLTSGSDVSALWNCNFLAPDPSRDEADMMCDGSWEDVQGELEGAASSCESYLPANNWQGLINLFGYYEAVPECEWSSARSSLTGLAGALERVEEELMSSIRFADQDYIQETKLYYDMVLGKLRRAGDLFLPGRLWFVDSGRYDEKIHVVAYMIVYVYIYIYVYIYNTKHIYNYIYK